MIWDLAPNATSFKTFHVNQPIYITIYIYNIYIHVFNHFYMHMYIYIYKHPFPFFLKVTFPCPVLSTCDSSTSPAPRLQHPRVLEKVYLFMEGTSQSQISNIWLEKSNIWTIWKNIWMYVYLIGIYLISKFLYSDLFMWFGALFRTVFNKL